MKGNRKRYKALEPRYKIHWKGTQCYYCGDKSNALDHVPAISIVYSKGAEYFEERDIKLIKVSACNECNSILGDKPLYTLDDRVNYLYKEIQERYKKILYSPNWEEDELEELGPNLRSCIQGYHDASVWLEKRLCYMEDIFDL